MRTLVILALGALSGQRITLEQEITALLSGAWLAHPTELSAPLVRRHLEAENRSERTLASYLQSVRKPRPYLPLGASGWRRQAAPTWRRSSVTSCGAEGRRWQPPATRSCAAPGHRHPLRQTRRQLPHLAGAGRPGPLAPSFHRISGLNCIPGSVLRPCLVDCRAVDSVGWLRQRWRRLGVSALR